MASDEVLPDAGESHASHQPLFGGNNDGNEENSRKRSTVRKRTKTGCLTCRKRRIKCDEGRPRCGNCTKSKRECEGYNQRVVFKETMGVYGGPYGVVGGYAVDPSHAYANHMVPGQPRRQSPHNSQPLLAPRPPSFDYHGQPHHQPPPFGIGAGIGAARPDPAAFNFNDPYSVQPMPPTPSEMSSGTSSSQPLDTGHVAATPWAGDYSGQGHEAPSPASVGYSLNSGPSLSPGPEVRDRMIAAAYDPDINVDDEASLEEMASGSDEGRDLAAVDRQQEVARMGRLNRLIDGSAIARHEIDASRMRTFSAYAQGHCLTTYVPTANQSGLRDAQSLAVFRHFIYVTGPSMSLYERHPFDHSKVSSKIPVPQTGQNIWTYTFPILSLGHPALLQAMLALGSLQIANLQMVPPTAAMKHYHLAIRRISKCVRSVTKRAHPATLAATLLLGYFEVWSSDHTKWCRHLYGARILFREVPFRHMTRTVLAAKKDRREKIERERQERLFDPLMDYNDDDDDVLNPELEDTDVEFLNVISGRNLDPQDYGLDFDFASLPPSHQPTPRDIEHYEHLRDLWWWNCKMDVYQSILGATRLFMPFDEWLPCPPRAPVGRLHAIYGTFDHLLLLLGRLSEFASEDLHRKRKANAIPGPPGGGSPPMFPGMFPTRGKVSAPVGFSPNPRDASSSPLSDGAADDGSGGDGLERATRAAMAEWESIREAFDMFRSRLGPEFQALGDEYTDRRETPFGTAVQYRTFSVAGIWLNLYMGLICLYRAHPSMPPAALMAAGRAARDTAPFAREIGRVAAGLSDEDLSNRSEITTLVGAAFIESSFCLFVAGIQYQDRAQRHWLIQRLHDISRLTGWASARQIADGCEASWVRAAHMGRGPPYVRSGGPAPPPSEGGVQLTVWSNPRRIDKKIEEMDQQGTLVLAKADRAHLALGLLGVEGDLDRLRLEDE